MKKKEVIKLNGTIRIFIVSVKRAAEEIGKFIDYKFIRGKLYLELSEKYYFKNLFVPHTSWDKSDIRGLDCTIKKKTPDKI